MIDPKATQKVTVVIGAGATLSDATRRPEKLKPPLDKGFFQAAKKSLTHLELAKVVSYMKDVYGIDVEDPEQDSFETVLGTIYTEICGKVRSSTSIEIFRGLLRIFYRRIAETTNRLEPTKKSGIYRILAGLFQEGVAPGNISVLTFNHDLQIEKTLQKLDSTKRWKPLGPAFSFPLCYRLTKCPTPTSPKSPGQPSSQPQAVFEIGQQSQPGIQVLKLHGSLNWYSSHISKNPSAKALLNPSRRLNITARRNLTLDMTVASDKSRKLYTFPVVIPPVMHKAGIMHKSLLPLWKQAEECLAASERVIIFGYSCPVIDHESAAMFRRAFRKNQVISSVTVIDPSPATFRRYVDITAMPALLFCRSVDAYCRVVKCGEP